MRRLIDFTGSIKVLAGAAAAFATGYSALDTPNINLFYSNYFAGLATGVALWLCLDFDE